MSGQRTYWVEPPGGGDPFEVAVVPEGDAWRVTVSRNGASSAFRIAEGDRAGRAWIDDRPAAYHWTTTGDGPGRLTLDGIVHALEVATEAQHRLAAMGLAGAGAHRAAEVRAPMPGLVLEIEAAEGSEVAAGGGLMIIEAMKMENEIKAPIAGLVADLAVEPGQPVEQGALLCRIEPPEDA